MAMTRARILFISIWITSAFFMTGFFSNCATKESNNGTPFPTAIATSTPTATATPLPIKKLTFQGVGSGGIFDPSIAKDPTTGKLWMSYSAVNPSLMFPSQNKISPHTRLAYSINDGEDWTDIGPVNQVSDVNLPLAPPNNSGTWMNEVSTLAYESGAPANERWKLMWHTFIKINGAPYFQHAWISIKMAATPEALAGATALKLFTSYLYDSGNNQASAATNPPIATAPAIQIDTAFPQLNKCIVSEPGLYANSTALYLSLQCEQINDLANSNLNDRLVFLFKCSSPCNVANLASWTYLGRIFNRTESVAVEPAFNGGYAAPAIAETPEGIYLIVTPTQEPNSNYRGCTVFKFSNLDSATLEKTGGVPKVFRKVPGTDGLFRGACGFNGSSTASGIFLSELSENSINGIFQIFLSRVLPE